MAKKTPPSNFGEKDMNLAQQHVERILAVLKSTRIRKGIKGREAARALEVDAATLLRIENGINRLHFTFYFRYCSLLEIDPIVTFVKALSVT